MPELIDLAESHNRETRVAWERARAQAAAWGIASSELYPTVAATALAGVNRDIRTKDGQVTQVYAERERGSRRAKE